MKIAFFGLERDKQEALAEAFPGAETMFFEEKLGYDTVAKVKDANILSVFVSDLVDKKIINALPDLKFIATRSTGYNHIDVAYAKEKGIPVAYVPGYGSYTVAEFAFGLILNLSRKITLANHTIKNSLDFNYNNSMEGFDLRGKTLGVIGTGKIGRNVIKIAKGFSMNVLACDLHPDQAFARENNFEYKSLAEIIAGSDIITLHVPYTKENHHLIGKPEILKMKKGVYIINTARGELIDTDALIYGLREEIIAGVGLDVLEGERELKEEIEILAHGGTAHAESYKTILEDRALMEMDNVIITPHIAFYSHEAVAEILKTTIENIRGFLDGSPVNLV